jgi:hypothetical protein
MHCTTRKITLVLFPHLTRDPISPLVGLDCLSWRQLVSQFTHGPGTHFKLEEGRFVGIRVNVLWVKYPDEVVKRCKRRWNEGLNTHVVLWWNLEDSKTPLEDTKGLLDSIAS